MNREDVDRWLEAYVAAWKSYDPEAIGDLFSEDVSYRYYPYKEPVRGRDAVVKSWLADPDEGTYEGSYRAIAVDGDVAVATGESFCPQEAGGPNVYWDNCFVMRFDADGRCSEFTEWFMQRPSS